MNSGRFCILWVFWHTSLLTLYCGIIRINWGNYYWYVPIIPIMFTIIIVHFKLKHRYLLEQPFSEDNIIAVFIDRIRSFSSTISMKYKKLLLQNWLNRFFFFWCTHFRLWCLYDWTKLWKSLAHIWTLNLRACSFVRISVRVLTEPFQWQLYQLLMVNIIVPR